MNIIETQAKSFIKELYKGIILLKIELLKERIDLKLLNFRREIDKLNFLKTLMAELEFDFQTHQLNCSSSTCNYESKKNMSLFLVNQEIEFINESYTYSPLTEDKFSVEEETNFHQKLNEILERLNKLGLGQEIIFDEIESLKSHFNLGKKTWFQLAYGKIISVSVDKTIEETIAKSMLEEFASLGKEYMKLV